MSVFVDETTKVVILPEETHALSKRPAAVGDAVTAWLLSSIGTTLRSSSPGN